MKKIFAYIFAAYLLIMAAAALFYMPTADEDNILDLNAEYADGKINISGKMAEGRKYRTYTVNELSGTYFVSIKEGLVGKPDFSISFDVDEYEDGFVVYAMYKNNKQSLIYKSNKNN